MVLKEVAGAMKKALRRGDYIGRYGGEEFLVVLSYPTLENAGVCADRIRKTIERLDIPFNGHVLNVTVSIGSTIYCPEETLDQVLARADQALYMAKKQEKNRVVGIEEQN
ncbi:MAG: GGDEF domain-containing protein [Thermodesulfobacteriota bacterium]|nr:GGDEF domain-containing protein [Thermodesulfobacteriota bacterium]